jgi:hypothetical protein
VEAAIVLPGLVLVALPRGLVPALAGAHGLRPGLRAGRGPGGVTAGIP